MIKYTLVRLLMVIPIMFSIILVTFIIFQVLPGDPVANMLGPLKTPELIEKYRNELGLNDSLWEQFWRYVIDALHGDLGKTFKGRRPVMAEILLRFPNTLQLALAGTFFTVLGGVSAGVIATVSKNKWIERFMLVTALGGLSIPSYWLATVSILIFSVGLKWVSATSGEGLKDLILPSLVIAVAPAAVLARTTRTALLGVMREDYVRTARAKGASEWVAFIRHILPNALIPVITVIGMQTADLMTGAIFIERVFSRTGLGTLAINSIFERDYPMVRGIVLFGAFIYVFANLFIDLMYGVIDPRIRYD